MKFSDDVVAFDFAGTPIVGCLKTGAVIGLTDDGAAVCTRLLEQGASEAEIAEVDAGLLEHLKLGGFFGGIANNDRVASAYLHVTQRCNLNCAGCYSLDNDRNALEDASLEDVERAVSALADAGLEQLVISGGEPFLRSDLPDIVRFAKESGIGKVTVLSNGTCFTNNSTLERMAPYVDCVSVSFDGCSSSDPAYIREEQRFDELVAAVEAVKAAGIPAHIIPTVHAKNIADLADYVALSKKLGATLNFSLLTCEPDDEALGSLLPGDAELKALGKSILTLDDGRPVAAMDAPTGTNLNVKRCCGAGTKTLSVAADGTIYPCHMMHRRELAMGNAFSGTVEEALRSEVGRKLASLDASRFEGCADCEYLYLCGGGCRARSLYSTGSLTAKDSYCTMIRSFHSGLDEIMRLSLGRR